MNHDHTVQVPTHSLHLSSSQQFSAAAGKVRLDDENNELTNGSCCAQEAYMNDTTNTSSNSSIHRLQQSVRELQHLYGYESITIISDDDDDNDLDFGKNQFVDDGSTTTDIHINSLVFGIERYSSTGSDVDDDDDAIHHDRGSTDQQQQQQPEYVLVIVGRDRRVNTTAVQRLIMIALINNDKNNSNETTTSTSTIVYNNKQQATLNQRIRVQLAPRDSVELLCGFSPGTVPPILPSISIAGMMTTTDYQVRPPMMTIVDESLLCVSSSTVDDTIVYYIGGGGQLNYSCRITLDVLVQQPETIVGEISTINPPRRSITKSQAKQVDNDDDNQDWHMKRANLPTKAMSLTADPSLPQSRPYFAIAGPSDTYEAQLLLSKLETDADPSQQRPTKNVPVHIQDGWEAVWEYQQLPKYDTNEIVSFVGRIGNIRRMARELSFCDLLPPDIEINTATSSNNNDDDITNTDIVFPWRNPVTDTKMSVQLICGKTLCQNSGGRDHAIRQIHTGQLLLIHGRTNLQSKNSLRNWIYNQTLDIVVSSYVLLLSVPMVETFPRTSTSTLDRRRPTTSPRKPSTNEPSSTNSVSFLRFADLYNMKSVNGDNTDAKIGDNIDNNSTVQSESHSDSVTNGEIKVNGDSDTTSAVSSHIVVVDDFQSIKQFSNDVSQLLQAYNVVKTRSIDDRSTINTLVGLVGIDCEWKPNFFLGSSHDPQPVLVLQISLHPLQRVYLFDLQTLLRPMMPQSQPMDKLEVEVSYVLQALFESKRLIKIGFHISNDLLQLAASYPHVPALQFYNAVVEASTLGKKAIRRTQSGNAREATSSLSRMVNHYIGKPLNKQEQCSDWSVRPLTDEQSEYAALDAAVTPIMVDKILSDLETSFFSDKPYLGRWEGDVSFKTAISSFRFVFIHTMDPNVQRKLKAKQIVGNPMIVSQSWITGDVPPNLPMIPESDSDGAYTDVQGIVQVPSVSVTIRSNRIGDVIDSMIGNKVGTSKDMCAAKFLHRPTLFPNEARLEFPQRSGFVEFKDGVLLFVNMQSSTGNRYKSKSYPNEWLLDGKVLTWFLRENDWKGGETQLAKKLLADPNTMTVTLYVRMGRSGEFICCGRCRVQDTVEMNNGYQTQLLYNPDSWTLIKLNLMLLDWKTLQSSANFQSLLHRSDYTKADDTDDAVDE